MSLNWVLVILRLNLASQTIVRRCWRLRAGGWPDRGQLSIERRSHARTRKLLTVDQGRLIMRAIKTMPPRHWKNAIIIPFSTSVISFRAVVTFFFGGAYRRPVVLLTIADWVWR